MIIPLKLEIEFNQQPISNYILIIITSVVFLLTLSSSITDIFEYLMKGRFNPVGLIGSIFMHNTILHLALNMLLVFVFGNAVCNVFGNSVYPMVYIILGVIASVIYLLFGNNPAVGARGAINGLMGLVLVWFPKNEMTFFFFFSTLRVKIIYGILFYIVLGLVGILLFSGADLSHVARFGGLVSGMVIGLILDKFKFVFIQETTLMDILTKTKKEKKIESKNYYGLQDIESEIELEEELSKINFTPMYEMGKNGLQTENVEVLQEAIPKFRVLRTVKSEYEVKCFIINEGDTITNVSAKSSGGIICEIFPAKEFKSNDTGVLKFNAPTSSETKITIFIIYDNSKDINQTEFIYDPALNKILLAEELK